MSRYIVTRVVSLVPVLVGVSLLVFVVCWELLSHLAPALGIPPFAIPSFVKIAKSFGDIRVTPTSFVIDRQGRILKQYLGEPEWSELHSLLDKALGDPA